MEIRFWLNQKQIYKTEASLFVCLLLTCILYIFSLAIIQLLVSIYYLVSSIVQCSVCYWRNARGRKWWLVFIQYKSELENSHVSTGVVNVIWLETVALVIIRILIIIIIIIIIHIIHIIIIFFTWLFSHKLICSSCEMLGSSCYEKKINNFFIVKYLQFL